jgi:hypothetical protein
MYQCAIVNETTNLCTQWVKVGFLGLPDITYSEATQLSVALLMPVFVAFCCKIIINFAKRV